MASRLHLQATAIATWEADGPQVHGADWQSQFHPYLTKSKNQTFWFQRGYSLKDWQTPSCRSRNLVSTFLMSSAEVSNHFSVKVKVTLNDWLRAVDHLAWILEMCSIRRLLQPRPPRRVVCYFTIFLSSYTVHTKVMYTQIFFWGHLGVTGPRFRTTVIV